MVFFNVAEYITAVPPAPVPLPPPHNSGFHHCNTHVRTNGFKLMRVVASLPVPGETCIAVICGCSAARALSHFVGLARSVLQRCTKLKGFGEKMNRGPAPSLLALDKRLLNKRYFLAASCLCCAVSLLAMRNDPMGEP